MKAKKNQTSNSLKAGKPIYDDINDTTVTVVPYFVIVAKFVQKYVFVCLLS